MSHQHEYDHYHPEHAPPAYGQGYQPQHQQQHMQNQHYPMPQHDKQNHPHPVQLTQPGPSHGMQIAQGGNRNAKGKRYDSHGEREWSNGLCDCCGSLGTCCLAVWCPCMVYGKTKDRIEHLTSYGQPHPDGGSNCTGDCCGHFCLSMFGLGWILQIGLRSSIRSRYRISGGCCGDCCSAFCCMPCELTQGRREVELEERSFRR